VSEDVPPYGDPLEYRIGYRHQLERARRFLDRVERPIGDDQDLLDIDEHAYQDMMWAFFQNCWHVKDWLCNDPSVPSETKGAVVDLAHLSPDLKMCQQLCNGTKHLGLRKGAKHLRTSTTYDFARGFIETDCFIDDGNGKEISGRELARRCIDEWERILVSQGLVITRPPDPLPPVLRG
jgi:hypothetical protein